MLLILMKVTTELEETSQIYMKCYRYGIKILPETTCYSTKPVIKKYNKSSLIDILQYFCLFCVFCVFIQYFSFLYN